MNQGSEVLRVHRELNDVCRLLACYNDIPYMSLRIQAHFLCFLAWIKLHPWIRVGKACLCPHTDLNHQRCRSPHRLRHLPLPMGGWERLHLHRFQIKLL